MENSLIELKLTTIQIFDPDLQHHDTNAFMIKYKYVNNQQLLVFQGSAKMTNIVLRIISLLSIP